MEINLQKIMKSNNFELSDFLKAPDLKDLNNEQIQKIAKSVLIDNLKDEFKKEVDKLKFDKSRDRLINRWLNKFESEHTKRSYRKNLNYFLEWIGERSILEIDYEIADEYISYLKKVKVENTNKKLSRNSQIQRIASVSSFYNSLIRWKKISNNPFIGSRKPKKIIAVKKAEQIPTEKEILELENIALKNINAKVKGNTLNTKRKNSAGKKAFLAIKILTETGLRVGALESLTIDRNGFYKANSKGGLATGHLSKEIIELIKKYKLNTKQPFKNYKASAFSIWFYRASKGKFSLHSLRHYFAINFYKRTKDIIALQRKLGHKSIMATQAYLSTLQTELGEI